MYNGSRRPKKLPVYVTEDEFSELLASGEEGNYDYHMPKPHRIACMFAFQAGLRISEVMKLQKNDIDFQERVVRIRQGKGGKDRQVPLPRNLRESHLEFIPFDFKDRALQKMFKRAAKRSGLLKNKPTVHFHSLRHGFAVHCLKQGINIKAIQKMLGHSDLSTTGIYLELCPDDIIKEYEEKF